jgi:hypothetical protein
MFEVIKWYMDVVSEDGSALFAYSARVRWGAARVSVGALCHLTACGRVNEERTLRPGRSPAFDNGKLAWSCGHMGLSGTWVATAAPIERTLIADDRGAIEWQCFAPRARAQVRVGDVALRGLGYVERLRITLPPAELPFQRLSWGRHLSSTHSLVWIDWHDGPANRWVFLDGVKQANARLTPHFIDGLDGGRSLRRGASFDLIERPAVASVARLAPRLAHRVAGPLATMREHKRVAESRLFEGTHALDHGWSLYEELA